jgi:hypothetical protein
MIYSFYLCLSLTLMIHWITLCFYVFISLINSLTFQQYSAQCLEACTNGCQPKLKIRTMLTQILFNNSAAVAVVGGYHMLIYILILNWYYEWVCLYFSSLKLLISTMYRLLTYHERKAQKWKICLPFCFFFLVTCASSFLYLYFIYFILSRLFFIYYYEW